MKRFLIIIVVIGVTFLLCSNVYATHRTWNRSTAPQDAGFYIGGTAGLNLLDDSSLINANPVDVNYDSGLTFGGILGYDFGMVRLDAEIAYRTNDISDIITPLGGFPAEGSTTALSYMINGYFDIPTNMVLKPYLGAGIGYATVSINDANIPGVSPVADDSDSVLAYQFSGGIGFEITSSTTLSFGYRYFATDDPEMLTVGSVPFTTEYQSHEFNIGVRFLFH